MDVNVSIDEIRREKRRRTLKTGLVFLSEEDDPIKCNIINWSAGGARLHFDEPFDTAEPFKLQIGFGELVLATVDCKIAWRRDSDVGVQFEEELPFEVSF